MIALGCKYLRICHLNNCATGVATQNNVLAQRALHRPAGDGDQLLHVSLPKKCVRDMAAIGARSSGGHHRPQSTCWKPTARRDGSAQESLDLSPIVSDAGLAARTSRDTAPTSAMNTPFDEAKLARSRCWKKCCRPIEGRKGGSFEFDVCVTLIARSVRCCPARSLVATGINGMEDSAPLELSLDSVERPGRASAPGMSAASTSTLTGDANDYVGKGMTGGCIVVIRPPKPNGDPHS